MKQFLEDVKTPSNMPVRQLFGNWTGFVRAMGLEPNKSSFSKLARINCIKAHKGKRSMGWKGGKIKTANGYIQLWKPEHPNSFKNGYIQEHTFNMSENLKRPLNKFENIHHKNGNRQDNRIINLELWNTMQPAGQRIEDKLKYAKQIIQLYG